MKLLIASSNPNKVLEIRKILPGGIDLLSLADLGYLEDLPETGANLVENAIQKVDKAYELFDLNCFAEDTGLEVQALNGKPGVYSARYAGEEKSSERNIDKLLSELAHNKNRVARFKTVIALYWNGKLETFEGVLNGTISTDRKGINGFGYDPVFIPDSYDNTLGELSSEVKNSISHRAMALKKLLNFLEIQSKTE